MVRKLPATLFLFLLAATVSVAAEIKVASPTPRTWPKRFFRPTRPTVPGAPEKDLAVLRVLWLATTITKPSHPAGRPKKNRALFFLVAGNSPPDRQPVNGAKLHA